MAATITLMRECFHLDGTFVSATLERNHEDIGIIAEIQYEGESTSQRFPITENEDGLTNAFRYICAEASSFMIEEDREFFAELLLIENQGWRAELNV